MKVVFVVFTAPLRIREQLEILRLSETLYIKLSVVEDAVSAYPSFREMMVALGAVRSIVKLNVAEVFLFPAVSLQ